MKLAAQIRRAMARNPRSSAEDAIAGARIALEEWLRRYAKPEVSDPIGLADELLHELDQ